MSSPGKSYRLSSSTHLELDELEELLVVDRIALVEGDDDVRNTDLAREHDVLPGLGIGPSVAATTRIAPSIWAAPVIMFLM